MPVLATVTALAAVPDLADAAGFCQRTITSSVVVFDQPPMFNRLGAQNVNGIVYALERDVINLDSKLPLTEGGLPIPGQVALRPDKRPRPLVLRAVAGDCLEVHFRSLLTKTANPRNATTFVGNLLFASGSRVTTCSATRRASATSEAPGESCGSGPRHRPRGGTTAVPGEPRWPEVEPGVHAGRVRLPTAGSYQVALLLDAPRLLHCFSFEVAPNPALRREGLPFEINYLAFSGRVVAGATATLRFRLRNAGDHEPTAGLDGVAVRWYGAPAGPRSQTPAPEVGGGVYEAPLRLREPGAYYLHVGVPSEGVAFGALPYRTLLVTEGAGGGGKGSGDGHAKP